MSKISAYNPLGSPADNDLGVVVDVNDTTMASSGTTKRITLAALQNDQNPARSAGFVNAIPLIKAIALRDTARCDIAVIGDSVTEGQGATAFTSRYIAQLNKAARQHYPTVANTSSGGQGFIPIQSTGESTYTWPVALASGSFNSIDVGPVRYGANMFGAQSYTWTAPAGTTSVKIMYFDAGVAGSFTWKINSGGTTTITNAGTLEGALSAGITITSGQVLTIAWVSGSAFPEGIIHYAGDESSGLTFHGCGHFGWNSGTGSAGWQQAGSGFDWRPAIAKLSTGAVAIMLGINDATSGGGNFTGAQFQTSITTMITYLRGNASLASLPVLLLIPYKANETVVDAGGWAAYAAALRAIEASVSQVHCIDLNYRMPSIASDTNSLYYDTVHPANAGHAVAGEIVAAGVRIA